MKNVNDILQLASSFEKSCQDDLVKLAKIRKLPNGKYRVLSEEGKNLGTYNSRDGAKKRLKQVEYFKQFDHADASDSEVIDLTDIDEFAYSAIMRKLRQKCSKEHVKEFLQIYKSQFDKAVKEKIQKPEKVALQNTVIKFNKLHKIKFDKKMIKSAAVSELGSAEQVGRYLADIVRFALNRVSLDKRQSAIASLKDKFHSMNEAEISGKQMPQSSAMGQSITFVKHVLFGQDPGYVRDVLNSLSRSL